LPPAPRDRRYDPVHHARGVPRPPAAPDLAVQARPGAVVPAVRQRAQAARRTLTSGDAKGPHIGGPSSGKPYLVWLRLRLTNRTRAPPPTRTMPASSIGPELAPVNGRAPPPPVVLVAAPTAVSVVVVSARVRDRGAVGSGSGV